MSPWFILWFLGNTAKTSLQDLLANRMCPDLNPQASLPNPIPLFFCCLFFTYSKEEKRLWKAIRFIFFREIDTSPPLLCLFLRISCLVVSKCNVLGSRVLHSVRQRSFANSAHRSLATSALSSSLPPSMSISFRHVTAFLWHSLCLDSN